MHRQKQLSVFDSNEEAETLTEEVHSSKGIRIDWKDHTDGEQTIW